jgi:hypothetical protein
MEDTMSKQFAVMYKDGFLRTASVGSVTDLLGSAEWYSTKWNARRAARYVDKIPFAIIKVPDDADAALFGAVRDFVGVWEGKNG